MTTLPAASRLLPLAVALACALCFGACKNTDDNPNPGLYPWQLPENQGGVVNPPRVVSIRLEPGGGLNLAVGSSVQFRAIGLLNDALASEVDVTGSAIWQQTNNAVGTLDATGGFAVFAPGQTTISASADGVSSDGAFVFATSAITTAPTAVQNLGGEILAAGRQFRLNWAASPAEEAVIGYLVYRSRVSATFDFLSNDAGDDGLSDNLLTPDSLPGLEFTDTEAVGGVAYYVVQAVRFDVSDPGEFVYGAPSRQLKVNFVTGDVEVGE